MTEEMKPALRNPPVWKVQMKTAIGCFNGALSKDNWWKPKPLHRDISTVIFALRPILPYAMVSTGEPDSLILVTRNRQPLGLGGRDYVDYRQFPWAHIMAGEAIAQLGPDLYFFQDSSAPWLTGNAARIYLELLCALVDPSLDLIDPRSKARFLLAESIALAAPLKTL